MGDIQMGVIFSLLSTILPDVRTQDPSGSCVDDMCSSMESTQGISSFHIDLSIHCLTDSAFFHLMIKVVKEALAYFLDIIDLIVSVAEEESTQIMYLSS